MITIGKLMEEIKRGSSKWIKSKDKKFRKFYWQGGYGAFSVSQSQVKEVESYIERQKEHHKKYSFQEKFINLLEFVSGRCPELLYCSPSGNEIKRDQIHFTQANPRSEGAEYQSQGQRPWIGMTSKSKALKGRN